MYTLTDKNFRELIQSEPSLMVNFSADWCGTCKAVAPAVEQIDQEYSSLVAKLDVDENPATAAEYGIRSIPTFLFFKNGSLVDRLVGAVSKSTLINKINSLTSGQ